MKRIVFIALLTFTQLCVNAQDFGLSFSYFIPKDGDFSTPISPFSIRGLGVNLNNFISLETGASLYRMSGLNVIDMPFQSRKAIVGPNFTLMVPGELVITLQNNKLQLDLKGGGFGFITFGNKLNYGNLDRSLREYEGWAVANSSADFKSKPGFGWMTGMELTIHVTQQWGISLETNYLAGKAAFPIKGTYTGGNATLETKSFDYTDAKLNLTGLEFSVGVIISSGGGGGKPKARRRR